jgi:tetratricopeptide (TPR) repeat protein
LEPEEWLALSAFVRYDSVFLDASVELVPNWVRAGVLDPHLRREVIAALRLFGAEIYWTPGAHDTYFSLARILHELSELRPAIASYVLSIETVGPSVGTYVNLALALRALRRRPEALESLRDALALDPSDVVARGWLGRIELELAGQLPTDPGPPDAGGQ